MPESLIGFRIDGRLARSQLMSILRNNRTTLNDSLNRLKIYSRIYRTKLRGIYSILIVVPCRINSNARFEEDQHFLAFNSSKRGNKIKQHHNRKKEQGNDQDIVVLCFLATK